jgi:D-amino peptidase
MSDIVGVSGIVVRDQVNGGAPMYEEGRKLYTQESARPHHVVID